jgi:hypothetical protein
MEVIVPAAGLSTRFPNMPPKYLLTDSNGDMMLQKAVEPYLNNHVIIGILQEHDEKYNAKERIYEQFSKDSIDLVVLPQVTTGPAATIFEIIERTKIEGNFLIKDCDSYFEHTIAAGNYVCVSKVKQNEILYNLAGKSFVQSNDQGIITEIIEKQVISDKFCVGGYKFADVKQYLDAYRSISSSVQNEIFVSHVIQYMLMQGEIFFENIVSNYSDVGTIEEWKKYNESFTR